MCDFLLTSQKRWETIRISTFVEADYPNHTLLQSIYSINFIYKHYVSSDYALDFVGPGVCQCLHQQGVLKSKPLPPPCVIFPLSFQHSFWTIQLHRCPSILLMSILHWWTLDSKQQQHYQSHPTTSSCWHYLFTCTRKHWNYVQQIIWSIAWVFRDLTEFWHSAMLVDRRWSGITAP